MRTGIGAIACVWALGCHTSASSNQTRADAAGEAEARAPGPEDASDAAESEVPSLVEGAVPATDATCGPDLTSDPANCGVCGHGCGGGACVLGRCAGWLIASAGGVASIAADASYVAWSDGAGNVAQVDSSGSRVDRTDAVLAAGAGAGPVLAGGTIGWLSPTPSVVASPEGTGGAGSFDGTIPSGAAASQLGIGLNPFAAYFLAPSASGVDLLGCALTGASSTCTSLSVVAPAGSPSGLVATSRLVFSLVNDGSSSTIICYDIESQSQNPSFQTGTHFGPIASDDAYLYWAGDTPTGVAIWRTPVDGGDATPIASGFPGAVAGLATDGRYAYFSAGDGSSSTLWYVPVDGSAEPVKLYETSGSIPGIAAAGGAVYFADVAKGSPIASRILGIVPP